MEISKKIKKNLSILIPQYFQNFIKRLFIKAGKGTRIISPHRIDCPHRIEIGENVYIGRLSTLSCYGGKLKIGDNTYATRNLNIYCGESILIEKDVLIGSFVLITDLSHGINPEEEGSYQKQKISTRPVFIGEGCWLGDKVSILPGAKIGKKSVIGSNAVVKGDIPAYSMVAGGTGEIIKSWDFKEKKWVKNNREV